MTDRPSILITGATRGIGRAVADDLAPDHHLLIGGRNAADVAAVCEALPSAEPFVADLADEDATARAASEVGELHGVVHSAAILGPGTLHTNRRTDWRRVFEVNVFAVADLTRLLVPQLAATRGTVVMINSGSGLNAHGPGGIYSASKFALHAFTGALREEVSAHGIRVSGIHPGRVATDMQQELRAFEGGEYVEANYLTPQSVAAAVRLALTADDSANVDLLSLRPAPKPRALNG